MWSSAARVCLSIVLLVVQSVVVATHVNSNIQRNIVLTSRVAVRESYVFQVMRSSVASEDYVLTLHPISFAGRVAQVECQVNQSPLKTPLEVKVPENVNATVDVIIPSANFADMKAMVISCDIIRAGRQARRPLPDSLPQLKKQYYYYDGAKVRVMSKYALEGEEKTVVLLPSTKVESRTSFAPDTLVGKTLTYGPYAGGESSSKGADVRLTLHYEHDSEMPVFTTVEKELEISHWGAVSVEEFCDLRHDGAKLEGFYSRLDHDKKRPGASFQYMYAMLPASASEVYYRDNVGNVTTSTLFKKPKSLDLLIQLRFPLYGGWHIEWYDGYIVPVEEYVKQVGGGQYRFAASITPSFKSVLTESMKLKIVLPAGAYDIKIVEYPKFSFVSKSESIRSTFLDFPWAARELITFQFRDVLTEDGSLISSSPGQVVITYKVTPHNLLIKPITVAGGIFISFVLFLIVSRVFSSPSSSSGGGGGVNMEKKNQ